MRKVKLRMNEQLKYETIKDLVDHNGNKKRAALKLDLSVRQVNRLIQKYKKYGKDGFVHGNRSRTPVNSLSQELCNKIIELYSNKYQDFNFCHFRDKLAENEGISISYGSIYTILTNAGYSSPKIHRATRRRIAKAKYQAEHQKEVIDDAELDKIIDHKISLEDAHPRQQRCKYFGEELQMDGSIHNWIEKEKWCLHLAIDNATGSIVGAYFDYQETLNGYYHITEQFLTRYGVPYRIKTDNRTVFIYNSLTNKTDEKDTLTQYGYMCKQLGIELITTSVSQAKGMIERANGTFQGRLVNELKLMKIDNISEANIYLNNVFVPDFNRKFADTWDACNSVFVENTSDINTLLSIRSPRKLDSGNAIKYKGKYYQPYDKDGNLACFKPKTECLVTVAYDGSLYLSVDDELYALRELIKNKKVSSDIDPDQPPVPKKPYIPPMSHPWKRTSYEAYRRKAHSSHSYAQFNKR